MEYLKLLWQHQLSEDPVVIFYEVDTEKERLAGRSIDLFADGSAQTIQHLYEDVIEIVPIPTVEEFNAHIGGKSFGPV